MSETISLTPLNLNVLVLNKHYMALRVVGVKRAFSLLCRQLAEVVSCERDSYFNYDFSSWVEVSEYRHEYERYNHEWITTARLKIAIPRIIRLLDCEKIPHKASVKLNRSNIFARDKHKCQYCNKRFPTSELSIDHVIPRSQGGQTTWDNVVCACTSCNGKKGGRTPHQAGMKLIKKPQQPKRNPALCLRMNNPRYESWKKFLDYAYWSVELK